MEKSAEQRAREAEAKRRRNARRTEIHARNVEAHKEAERLEQAKRQIAILERQQVALKARERLMPFIKFTSPDPEHPNDVTKSSYKNAKHHDAIARAVEEVIAGNIPFLILTCPPRHGKSEIVSRRLPAYIMGRFPHWHGIVATYSDDFAGDFGSEVREIVRSPQFKQVFPGVTLLRGGSARDRLQTNHGGQWTFVGRGGSLTGRGGHIAICDDLIKDDEEAQSEAIRDKCWNWFRRVLMSRRMGMKLVIMTFTRWHADDPIGRLTDPDNPHYSERLASRIKIINLPAIAEEDDPLGREPGAPLWPDGPDNFDLDFLEEQRALDPLGFEALYQQRPSLLDGDLFKREDIRRYRSTDLPEELRFYCASDHAVGVKQRNDPSCFLKAGIDTAGNLYLTDCIWRRMKTDVAVERMLDMGCRGNQKPLLWFAEKGHISKSIGPFLHKRMQEIRSYMAIREITPVADKAQRAQSIVGRVAMGKVFFPADAPWAEKAINEMMAFPNGTHDDFVDALALFGLGLRNQFNARKARAKEPGPPEFGTLDWVKLSERWEAERKAKFAAGRF